MASPFSIREGIKQALLANANLLVLVPATMIWAQFAPLNTTPSATWIVLSKVSAEEESSHSGNDNLTKQRFQFTVGGPDKVVIDKVCDILIREFNAISFLYTEASKTYELTFFHADDRDGWDEASRTYNPSVDLFVQTNYQ